MDKQMLAVDRDELPAMLRAHGILPTQQRVMIARVLFARHQHFSADQVLREVNTGDEHVSKATVYNTLGLFARNGLVREVIVDPTRVFYDPNTDNLVATFYELHFSGPVGILRFQLITTITTIY